jgi:hypothetical protein
VDPEVARSNRAGGTIKNRSHRQNRNMNDAKNTEKRDANGRFLRGHKPPKSPGRPPGPNGVKARAAKLAGERLEELLQRATAVVESELEARNPQVAMWLVDRVRPSGRSDFITLDVQTPLSPENLVASAREVNAAVLRGDVSLQQGQLLLDLLERQGRFEVLKDLEMLRAELDSLKREASTPRRMDRSLLPAWGRFREAADATAE